MRSGMLAMAVLGTVGACTVLRADHRDELEAPFRVKAGEEHIDVEVGHAAPFVGDFDGDGINDLLVGQFGGGKLRIYRNAGSNEEPKFEDFEWFHAGGELGTVPAG